jgi:hypothetical protein
LNWGSSTPEPLVGESAAPNFQNLGDRYIGCKFKLGLNTHYGWVRVNFSSLTLVIKDYAYESTPNQPINAGQTTSTIVVTDTIKPVITLNGGSIINVFRNQTYVEQGATAIDNIDGNITHKIITTSNVNTSMVGTYHVSYVVSDLANNKDSVVRTVNVIQNNDSIPPVITLIGNSVINLFKYETYVEQGATAFDNKDGNISNQINISGSVNTSLVGKYFISYTVKDLANNFATVLRTVNVLSRDTVKPVITLLGSNPDKLQIFRSYADLGATASDANDGNLTNKIIKVSNIDSSKIGTYTITYTVRDSANNEATAVRTVNVVKDDTIKPVITLNGEAVVSLKKGTNYIEKGATASDNIDGNISNKIIISGSVLTNIVGTYFITYKVTINFIFVEICCNVVVLEILTYYIIIEIITNIISIKT